MAALIKGQILKHLSKFTKNLSPDKLQLSALKGSCEVSNIELNEAVLMDLLELPLWLCLTKATCNYVSIKIQWMKLKTIPIYLSLDEVIVEMETCEHYRNNKSFKSNQTTNNDSGKYGFTDRVFDGMTVTINSVIVKFKSHVFTASLQLSRLVIESRSPAWKRNVDLRLTRIKDANRGQILIFKHLEWQTLRLEAKAETNIVQTPLRLITNQSSCRITIKKKLSDCSVLGARIMFIFDDLLWVLTDAQLLSALHFAKYLIELIKKSPQTKRLNEEIVAQTQSNAQSLQSQSQPSVKNIAVTQLQSTVSRLFSQYDIIETSHHIFVSRIEIHLCDDLDPNNSRSLHSSLKDGGALQITALKLVIDVYPYQKVMASRQHWLRYSEPSSSRSNWIDQHLQLFADKINKKKQLNVHAIKPSNRSQANSVLSQLMSRVVLIRLGDYSVSCVTTNSTSKSKLNEKLISTDKSAPLPDDMVAFYMEISNYYYFESNEMVPNSTAFIHLAPLKVCFDAITLLWINAFQANLHKAMVKLQELLPKLEEKDKLYTRIECLMPMICFKCPHHFEWSTFEIKSARIVVSNCENEKNSFDQLNDLMNQIGLKPFFYERNRFPWIASDLKPVSDNFFKNITGLQSDEECGELWTIKLDPCWLEFRENKTNRLIPFIEPIPIIIWAFDSSLNSPNNSLEPDINLLLCINSAVRILINRNKYIFLMRFMEELSEFSVQLSNDTVIIEKDDTIDEQSLFKKLSLITSIPKIELMLILSEEYHSYRSIGVSPLQSIADISPSIDEQYSIKSELSNIPLLEQKEEAITLPKSHSDSLLHDIKTSFDSNNSKLNEINISEDMVRCESLNSSNSLNKLQNTSISFKKGLSNYDALSAKSISTMNESGYVDSSPNDDDNRSIRSDLSADSDQFVVVGFETMTIEDDIFGVGKVETAIEVREDSIDETNSETDSENVQNSNSSHPISITLLEIKLSNLNLVQQSHGFYSKLLLQLSEISMNEHIKMPFTNYQEFINQKPNLKNYLKKEETDLNSNISSVCMRLDSFAKLDLKDELLSIIVNDISDSLQMDTVMQLNDLITDEDLTVVTPINILLNKICIKLNDDKVKTPPLMVNIPYCFIERNNNNQILISPLSQNILHNSNVIEDKLLNPHLKLIESYDHSKTFSYLDEKLSKSADETDLLSNVLKENELLQEEIKKLKIENLNLYEKLKTQ